jgi:hypothetical protein
MLASIILFSKPLVFRDDDRYLHITLSSGFSHDDSELIQIDTSVDAIFAHCIKYKLFPH